jgi:hypothetical protein
MAAKISSKQARAERDNMIILKHKFDNRITITKFGKEALDNGDYSTALQRFVEYMNIMAETKKVKDFYSLKPTHFDSSKQITEMLMISHLFFEMGRIFDAVPKFHEDSKKCMEQFVAFTINQPFQVVNSEMIRKHLKKSQFKRPEIFRAAYEQIFVQSKKCYVVTFCYGTDHPVTEEFRQLKDWLLQSALGMEFVRHYYRLSSVLVGKWENNVRMHLVSKVIFRPVLVLFSKTILPFIIK